MTEEHDEHLEKVVQEKVKPIITRAMHEHLGITVQELEKDITDTLTRTKIFNIRVRHDLTYKKAKKEFKKEFIQRLLREHSGNVQQASKSADVDRRTLHRLITEFKIESEKYRIKQQPDYTRKIVVQDLIQKTIEQYKTALHPEKAEHFYKEAPQLSEQIIRELPEEHLTMQQAETIFEKEYIENALTQNEWNVRNTSKSIGLAEETIHRKIKELGIERGIINDAGNERFME